MQKSFGIKLPIDKRGNLQLTDDTAMENLVRYITRASFSQQRMQYLDQEGTVIYTSSHNAF